MQQPNPSGSLGHLRIGEVARQSGMGVESLRFYENRGLIQPVARTPAGYRLYDPSIFERLSFIKKAQAVGFSLDEIGRIIAEARTGKRPCAEVRRLAAGRLAELEQRIAELRRYRKELRETLEAWEREGEKDGIVCGLIEGLKPASLHPPSRVAKGKRKKSQRSPR